jgi:sulfoxide reductase heme-binding subunit YedZ
VLVLLGLAMATKVLRGGVKAAVLMKLHEHLALSGLVAIAVHAITLLGDAWLNPRPASLLVPFTMSYRPLFTGLGTIAAYLAALLGSARSPAPVHADAGDALRPLIKGTLTIREF